MRGAASGSGKAGDVPWGCRRVGDAFPPGWDLWHPGEGCEAFSLLKQQRNILEASHGRSAFLPWLCPTWHSHEKLQTTWHPAGTAQRERRALPGLETVQISLWSVCPAFMPMVSLPWASIWPCPPRAACVRHPGQGLAASHVGNSVQAIPILGKALWQGPGMETPQRSGC